MCLASYLGIESPHMPSLICSDNVPPLQLSASSYSTVEEKQFYGDILCKLLNHWLPKTGWHKSIKQLWHHTGVPPFARPQETPLIPPMSTVIYWLCALHAARLLSTQKREEIISLSIVNTFSSMLISNEQIDPLGTANSTISYRACDVKVPIGDVLDQNNLVHLFNTRH